MTLPNDFLRNVSIGDGCWDWMGAKSGREYGSYRHGQTVLCIKMGATWKSHPARQERGGVGPAPPVSHSDTGREP